jgi:hypothetical protein
MRRICSCAIRIISGSIMAPRERSRSRRWVEAKRSEDLRRGIEAKKQQRPGARGFGNQGSRVCVGVSLFLLLLPSLLVRCLMIRI